MADGFHQQTHTRGGGDGGDHGGRAGEDEGARDGDDEDGDGALDFLGEKEDGGGDEQDERCVVAGVILGE